MARNTIQNVAVSTHNTHEPISADPLGGQRGVWECIRPLLCPPPGGPGAAGPGGGPKVQPAPRGGLPVASRVA